MTTSTNTSAVTNVTPIGAGTSRRGKAPLVLKGGKLWSEARDEAKAAVTAAKKAVADAVRYQKDTQKTLDGWPKAIDKGNKNVSTAEAALAKEPKNPLLKQAVKEAKQAVKDFLTTQKAAAKANDGAIKAVEKAKAALQKAEANLAKVEAQKADAKPQVKAA